MTTTDIATEAVLISSSKEENVTKKATEVKVEQEPPSLPLQQNNRGIWSDEEKSLAVEGFKVHGKGNWTAIRDHMKGTRVSFMIYKMECQCVCSLVSEFGYFLCMWFRQNRKLEVLLIAI